MSEVISVKNLTYTYGGNTPFVNDAISDITFSIESGEIIGIIGHTGSGKSTLVQHLNGLIKATSGEVLYRGKNIWENPKKIKDIRFKIGLVFQYPEYQLFEETVFKDIAYGPSNMGLSGDELNKRVFEICSLLDIPNEYIEKSPFDLSGGEKRRVAIAGVMAMQPDVLVLDEPVAGLDPKGRADVIKMINAYRNTYNATVIIISHNMEDMALLADRLLVMNNGKAVCFDKTEKVFSNADTLKSIGLNVPIVTSVLLKLKEKNPNIRADIFTVDKAVEYLLGIKAEGDKNA
ncbi:MAG: energy-coupling factor transporter ATPase [Clostridia bacterium]|nr:energy-coupling factor transporter ATPase [Clostridia bacterium]